MKLQYPFLLCICLGVVLYCAKKADEDTTVSAVDSKKNYMVIVDRGAFHYDKFVLTSNKIEYHPNPNDHFENSKYNQYSQTKLDSTATNSFFTEIETKGFWDLKNSYEAYASCASELKITLISGKKTKTVICDDYNSYCHELIKYIDKKVVELEGNDLKRIYLPG